MIAPLLFGLIASVHCAAMCGPLALALPVHRMNTTRKTVALLLYHAGRITVYVVLGLLFGTLGKGLFLAGFQQNVSVTAGILLIAGVLLFNEKKMESSLAAKGAGWYLRFKNAFGQQLRKRNAASFVVLGMLNGLLPCAMIYMALFGATATQGTLYGALFMFCYGLGTVPLLTTVVWAGQWLGPYRAQKIQRFAPVFLFVMGVFLIVRGLGLDIPYVSPATLQLFITGNPQCF